MWFKKKKKKKGGNGDDGWSYIRFKFKTKNEWKVLTYPAAQTSIQWTWTERVGCQISSALNSGTEATHTTDGLSYLGDASISTDASRNWPTGELLYWCVILSDYIQLRKTNGDCGD